MELSVSIVIPCRNEVTYIDDLLTNIAEQSYPSSLLEVLVADGMSSDGTRGRLKQWQNILTNLRIINNPKLIVSTGLNEATRMANGDIIIRMDVHTKYASNYIEESVNTLTDSKADNVGGPWQATCKTYLQCAIASAFQSPFAVGGARSHNVDYEGDVDTVYLGCWYKDKLLELGGFDEDLVRNQDDELNFRIIEQGGRVYQSPKIISWYYPRASLIKLFNQYAQYGYWKVRVIRKYGKPASLRHLVPALFVLALLGSIVLLLISGSALPLLLVALPYLTADLFFSVRTAIGSKRLSLLPVLPIIFPIFHIGYGYGFLRAVLDAVLRRGNHSQSFRKLTRK